MSAEAAAVAGGGRGISRLHRPWLSPIWIAFVGWQWWIEIQRNLAGALPADVSQVQSHLAAGLGAAGHLVGNAIEALFYILWWRAWGRSLSFARLYEWLVSISALDLLAASLIRVAESHPGWVALALEVFVGLGALDNGSPGTGFGSAFGSVGLLCVARLVATAEAQRRGAQGGLVAPLGLTVAVWLVGRLASWWMFDLARGVSPLP